MGMLGGRRGSDARPSQSTSTQGAGHRGGSAPRRMCTAEDGHDGQLLRRERIPGVLPRPPAGCAHGPPSSPCSSPASASAAPPGRRGASPPSAAAPPGACGAPPAASPAAAWPSPPSPATAPAWRLREGAGAAGSHPRHSPGPGEPHSQDACPCRQRGAEDWLWPGHTAGLPGCAGQAASRPAGEGGVWARRTKGRPGARRAVPRQQTMGE